MGFPYLKQPNSCLIMLDGLSSLRALKFSHYTSFGLKLDETNERRFVEPQDHLSCMHVNFLQKVNRIRPEGRREAQSQNQVCCDP